VDLANHSFSPNTKYGVAPGGDHFELTWDTAAPAPPPASPAAPGSSAAGAPAPGSPAAPGSSAAGAPAPGSPAAPGGSGAAPREGDEVLICYGARMPNQLLMLHYGRGLVYTRTLCSST
jgi:hypothetical protein